MKKLTNDEMKKIKGGMMPPTFTWWAGNNGASCCYVNNPGTVNVPGCGVNSGFTSNGIVCGTTYYNKCYCS